MTPGDPAIQSFMIKIRLSELTPEESDVLWYGYITHVPSGKRQYFRHLNDVADFIQPFMEEMGISFRDNPV
jgi:hypothetical protein